MADFSSDSRAFGRIVAGTSSEEDGIGSYQRTAALNGSQQLAFGANVAVCLPVYITPGTTVSGVITYNGSTVSGNVDAGLYDLAGNRLASSGSVALGAANAVTKRTFTSPVTVNDGWSYLAVALDSGTATWPSYICPLPFSRAHFARQVASAFPLPSSVSFAEYTLANVTRFWAVA